MHLAPGPIEVFSFCKDGHLACKSVFSINLSMPGMYTILTSRASRPLSSKRDATSQCALKQVSSEAGEQRVYLHNWQTGYGNIGLTFLAIGLSKSVDFVKSGGFHLKSVRNPPDFMKSRM